MPTTELFQSFCTRLQKENVNVAILMSGGGSNAINILKNRDLYPTVHIAAIVTDQANSNAQQIAEQFEVEYVCLEGSVKTREKRTIYFKKLSSLLREHAIEALLYAGFMKITPKFFLEEFPGINSHPADLRVLDEQGHRKYVGMEVIKMTLEDNNKEIRCSCCVVEPGADEGFLIACSNPVTITPDDHTNTKKLHERMKQEAEWKYYPQVIKMISTGILTPETNLPYIFTTEDFS